MLLDSLRDWHDFQDEAEELIKKPDRHLCRRAEPDSADARKTFSNNTLRPLSRQNRGNQKRCVSGVSLVFLPKIGLDQLPGDRTKSDVAPIDEWDLSEQEPP